MLVAVPEDPEEPDPLPDEPDDEPDPLSVLVVEPDPLSAVPDPDDPDVVVDPLSERSASLVEPNEPAERLSVL